MSTTDFEILAVAIDCGQVSLDCLLDTADMQHVFDMANELGVTVEQLIAGVAPCACAEAPPPPAPPAPTPPPPPVVVVDCAQKPPIPPKGAVA